MKRRLEFFCVKEMFETECDTQSFHLIENEILSYG